ncbi:hypothetical protein [uncultured Pseudoteredinibacter sp.]|uniref:hypothetical protein n=1 Tax=uncultured Pseudoteredinibacter sp. TaxID=1641701 RepID=UPI0026174B08|nr:hypothetical protein [uncultured Pseudoteredinibacter sp.]
MLYNRESALTSRLNRLVAAEDGFEILLYKPNELFAKRLQSSDWPNQNVKSRRFPDEENPLPEHHDHKTLHKTVHEVR